MIGFDRSCEMANGGRCLRENSVISSGRITPAVLFDEARRAADRLKQTRLRDFAEALKPLLLPLFRESDYKATRIAAAAGLGLV